MDISFGDLNGHVIGHVMKKSVQNAILIIRAMRISAEVHHKDHPEGKEDFVTDADIAAQKEFLRILRESFPQFGIVAEEDDLSVPCTHPTHDLWFTVDPLDGTKAFTRGQSHGIGTMLSLVCEGEVIAAYVGDVMTGEIYGYRPGGTKVHRVGAFGQVEELRIDPKRTLASQQVVLREHPSDHTSVVQALVGLMGDRGRRRNRFKGLDIDSGSIGIDMARLWKGEVGAMILKAGRKTPWDQCPVLGISRKLGFAFVPIIPWASGTYQLGKDTTVPAKTIQRDGDEVIVVHGSRLEELEALFSSL